MRYLRKALVTYLFVMTTCGVLSAQESSPISTLLKEALELTNKQEYEEAISLFQKVLEKEGDQLTALQGMGVCYLFTKKYDLSQKYLQKALNKEPNNVTTLMSLGRLFEEKEVYYKAHFYYRKVLSLDPYHVEAYLGEGRVYNKDRQYRSAIKVFNKVLELDPYLEGALQGLGFAYRTLGDYHKALEAEKKILEIKPSNVEAMLRVASVYEGLENKQQAIFWYEKAKKINPRDDRVHAKLSILYSETDQIDQAVTSLKKLTELQEGNIKNFITLGRVYGWLSRVDEAIVVFEKVASLQPKNMEVQSDLAFLYLLNQQWDKAEKIYNHILKINPKSKSALEGMERVAFYKLPVFTPRFKYSVDKNWDNTSNITKSYKTESSLELLQRFAPTFSMEGRYQKNFRHQDDITALTRDYKFEQDIAALRFRYSFLKYYTLSMRGEYNYLQNKASNTYNFGKDLHRFSSLSYLLMDYGKFYGLASWSRGLLLRLVTPNILKMNPYWDYGATLGWNITQHLEGVFYYAYTDFIERKDQHDFETMLTYQLPFYKPFQIGYIYEYISEPVSSAHTAKLQFQEKFWKKLLFQLIYKWSADNNKDDQGWTYTNSLESLITFPIYKDVSLNFEGEWSFENGKDKDWEQTYRSYLTFPLSTF